MRDEAHLIVSRNVKFKFRRLKMAGTYVLYKKEGNIATVTLSRPEARNALVPGMRYELIEVFDEMSADDDILAVILTGDPRGKAFSAGANVADPKTHSVNSVGEYLSTRGVERNVFDVVSDFYKPVVCAINGYAVGWGFLITLCCDILIASENAEVGLAQVSLGVLPAYGGALRLARFVGKGHAMNIALTATAARINAQEAYRIGLVTQVVPPDDLMPTARKIAERLASLPPLAVSLAKESLNRGLDTSSIRDAARADIFRFLALMQTEDREEGHRAWREKRKPVFKGR